MYLLGRISDLLLGGFMLIIAIISFTGGYELGKNSKEYRPSSRPVYYRPESYQQRRNQE